MSSQANIENWMEAVADAVDVAGAHDLDQASPEQVIRAWKLVRTAAGLSPHELTESIAAETGVPVADLVGADSRAAVLIPGEVAHRWNVLPLRCDALKITVATSNPGSTEARRELVWFTGREVTLELAAPGELNAAVVTTYGPAPDWDEDRTRVGVALPEGPHVLVVDDEAMQRTLLRSLLEKGGYRVTVAKDGPAALELLSRERGFDLVTLDYWMDQINGLRVLQRIRADKSTVGVPVIVVTGAGDRQIEMSLFEAGADDFIGKPIDPPLFLLRVKAVLRRRSLG